MITAHLSKIYLTFFQKCERFTRNKYWILWLALISSLLAVFFAFPNYAGVSNDPTTVNAWEAIFTQIEHPFENHTYEAVSHQSKLAFRLSIPLLAKTLHLSVTGIICLQYAFGVFLFYFSSKVILQITKDSLTTLLVTLSLAFIYSGKVSFLDLRGVFDGIALFFLVLSLYKKNVPLIITCVFLTALTDERGLIAASFVFIYWFIHESNPSRKLFTKQTISVLAGGLLYLSVRFILTYFFQLKTESAGIGLQILASNLNLIPLGIWHGLEGNWIFIVITIFTLFLLKDKMTLFLFSSSIACILTAGCLVTDVSRSTAYILPALFVAIKVIHSNDSLSFLRKMAFVSLLICFIYPAYFTGGGYQVDWVYPLPLKEAFTYFTSE
jgi:hypothetical protein